MSQHKGKMIKRAIKECGISVSNVSKKMGISRGTLYNRFMEADIKDEFICELGKVIKYDFGLCTPTVEEDGELSDTAGVYTRKDTKLEEIQAKYIHLTKSYNKLLLLLTRLANKNTDVALQKEVEKVLAIEVKNLEALEG